MEDSIERKEGGNLETSLSEVATLEKQIERVFKEWKKEFEGEDVSIEEIENYIWESIIELNSNPIQEGTEAIILEVDKHGKLIDLESEDIPELQAVQEKTLKEIMDSETVVRLLKIFKRGTAEREINIQSKAREVLANSEVGGQIMVPEIKATKHSLKLHNPDIFNKKYKMSNMGSEVEFVVMDRVDGVDLATFAYQETLLADSSELEEKEKQIEFYSFLRDVITYKLQHKGKYELAGDARTRNALIKIASQAKRLWLDDIKSLPSNIDTIKRPEMRELFIKVYGLEKEMEVLRSGNVDLEGYIRTINDVDILDNLISSRNDVPSTGGDPREKTRKFYQVIKDKIGGKKLLPPELYESFLKAVRVLHDNDIYHRDLHSRNVMIDKNGRLNIIDFGRSTAEPFNSLSSNPYGAVDGEYMRDESLTVESEGLLYLLTH